MSVGASRHLLRAGEGAPAESQRARCACEDEDDSGERGLEAALLGASPGQVPGQRDQPLEGGQVSHMRVRRSSSKTDRQELAGLLAQPGAQGHLICSTPF